MAHNSIPTRLKSLIGELSAWDFFLIIGFTAASLAVSLLNGNFQGWSYAGGICSILCVIFGAKGNMLNFIFGWIGSLILGTIMFSSHIYAMAAFYILYNAPMQIVGWYKWNRRRLNPTENIIKTRWMSWPQRCAMVASTFAMIAIAYLILSKFTGDAQPLSDAAAVSVAVITQFVLTFAFIEQWCLWITMDIVMSAVWVIAWKSGVPHAAIQLVLEMFYLINAVRGLFLWAKLEKSNGNTEG
ncbi:MAG: nicotinamide riboside transporter PnuC [Bacteroidaceae bacterium]|nr:nicotinamide riboside transporter PnuC [Bacteroidaceae bacterium]